MRIKKFSILLAGLVVLVVIFICCPNAESKILLVDNFDEESFLNKLGGESYTWNVNPQDKSQGCRASFDSKIRVGEAGSSLRLDYDIDSTITYLRQFPDTSYYIYDYDTDSIIGFASEIPHTAYNGFYFLLNDVNLREYKYLVFYVKGDPLQGFTRKFVVELKNIDQTDRFLVDGVSSSWQKVVIPLGMFKRIGEWRKMTELTIVFNENVTRKTGTVYLDNIYFAQSPDEKLAEEGPLGKSLQGNPKKYSEEKKTDLGATIYTAYSYTPEQKNEIFSMGSLAIEGKLTRFRGKMEVQAETQNFGEAAYRSQLEHWPYEETRTQSPDLELSTLQFTVDDILPQSSRITLGHLWLDSSRYTFNPVYGWKGTSIDGDYSGLNYNAFFIKQPFNSFTLGSRLRQYWRYFWLEGIAIHHSETARLSSSTGDGTLEDTEEWKIEPVERDIAFMFRVLEHLLDYRIKFEGIYGHDIYHGYAEVDRTDPTQPIYSQKLDESISHYGNMWRGKLIFDNLLWRGAKLNYEYRWVGKNFKPEYRQEPTVFDDVYGDQRGYNVEFEQSYKGFIASVSYDDITRNSNRNYGRTRTNLELNYYGFRGMEFGISQEYRKEDYIYTSLRSSLDVDRNEKVGVTELYLRFHLIHPVTPGLRLPLVLWFKFRREDIEHPLTGATYVTDSFQTKIEYYPASYIKLLCMYKTTRFGDSSWEPKGYPFADNFTRIALEVMF